MHLWVDSADKVERWLGDQDRVGGHLHHPEVLTVGDVGLEHGGQLAVLLMDELLQPLQCVERVFGLG